MTVRVVPSGRPLVEAAIADAAPPTPASASAEDAGATRVRQRMPASVRAADYPCRKPVAQFCTQKSCRTLADFARTFNCHAIELQRCGAYRVLTVNAPLATQVAFFDDQGTLVAGMRASDGTDFCGGTHRGAYYGPTITCEPSDTFEPWCPP